MATQMWRSKQKKKTFSSNVTEAFPSAQSFSLATPYFKSAFIVEGNPTSELVEKSLVALRLALMFQAAPLMLKTTQRFEQEIIKISPSLRRKQNFSPHSHACDMALCLLCTFIQLLIKKYLGLIHFNVYARFFSQLSPTNISFNLFFQVCIFSNSCACLRGAFPKTWSSLFALTFPPEQAFKANRPRCSICSKWIIKRYIKCKHEKVSCRTSTWLRATFCSLRATKRIHIRFLLSFHDILESQKTVLFTKGINNGRDTRWIWLMRSRKFSTFSTASSWYLTVRFQTSFFFPSSQSLACSFAGKYGSYNKITKQWDGLVKHLLDRVSH